MHPSHCSSCCRPQTAAPGCAKSPTTTRRSQTVRLSCACWATKPGIGLSACAKSAAPAAQRACSTRCWATFGWCSATPICKTTCSTTLVDAVCWSRPCTTAWPRCKNAARPATTRNAMCGSAVCSRPLARLLTASPKTLSAWQPCGAKRKRCCANAPPPTTSSSMA